MDLPGDVSYAVIQPFVREAAKLAWNMTCLARPMDLSVSADGELFEDSKLESCLILSMLNLLCIYKKHHIIVMNLNI